MIVASLVVLTFVCLGLPPALRYTTASRMRRMHAELVGQDDEFRRLRDQLNALRDECSRMDRQQRHLELRRTRLHGEVEEARRELTRLRTPATERIAA
ncbi:MAG: hypothetical protein WDA75_18485 [Candidatus Latescibacterota bacterium]